MSHTVWRITDHKLVCEICGQTFDIHAQMPIALSKIPLMTDAFEALHENCKISGKLSQCNIKNERQYKITKEKKSEFLKRLKSIEEYELDSDLKNVMCNALASQIQTFNNEIKQYEEINGISGN